MDTCKRITFINGVKVIFVKESPILDAPKDSESTPVIFCMNFLEILAIIIIIRYIWLDW